MHKLSSLSSLLTILFFISSCEDLEKKVEQKVNNLNEKVLKIDSLVNKEFEKVDALDSLIEKEKVKLQKLDSLVNSTSTQVDSLVQNKVDRINRIIN
jgi:PBP1b-binding outer membrane lipoprotein LpoB